MVRLLTFLLCFFILTKFNVDPDFGWHMAYGETFLKTGEIIRADLFSWTMPNYTWGNSYFLYQIVVAYIFNKLGFLVLGLVFGLVAALAILILSFKSLNLFKTFFVVFGAVVASVNFAIRPHVISFFFFALLLIFLEKRFFDKSKHILLWFLFFMLWANIHRAFTVGILIFGAFLVLDFFERKTAQDRQKLFNRASCFAAGVLATLVTPFPLNAWKSGVFFDLTTLENLRFIAEWQPSALVPPASIFLAVSGLVFIFVLQRKHKEIGPTWAIVSACLFSLAFVSATLTFFWAAIFIFIVSRYLDIKLKVGWDFWSKVPVIFAVLAVLISLFLNFLAGLLESYNFENRLLLDAYPLKALEYLDKKGFKEGLFNDYEWGGFMDWKAPGVKVFIDGRMASWKKADGTSILGDYISITQGKCEVANKYKIQTVLTKRNSKLSCFDEWKVEYEDGKAKILRRPKQG